MRIDQLRAVVAGVAVAIVGFAGQAQASPIYVGTGWSVPLSTSSDVPPDVSFPGPGATKWVEFTASALNFSGDCPFCYNIGDFLNSGGALLSATYFNFADPSTNIDSTVWQFTGTALFTNGQSYSVRHDDGVRLYVDGVALFESPGITGPVTDTFTYTGVTGDRPFDFLFANCCATQADFQMELTPASQDIPVPEPASLTLLGTGILAMARSLRRRA